jgi:UDP-glucose 4-epimerase
VSLDPLSYWARPRRILVTGCAGFLGSSLVDSLLEQGHQVVGIDSFSDYYDPALKRENLSGALQSTSFELIEGDLNELDLNEFVRGKEVVFHLAAQAGVRASWGSEFDLYLRANVRATQLLLEALVANLREGGDLRRLVYSSSSSVYGNQEHYPVKEGVDKHPFSPYGVTKLAAEHLCELYATNYGLPCSSLRYFTVYGPRQRPDMAFHKFLRASEKGEPWLIYGDGQQSRDFTYVEDVVRANLLAGAEEEPYAAYNIGGGARQDLLSVLEILSEKVQEHGISDTVRIEHGAPVKGDVRHTGADGSRARSQLKFSPRIGLEAGLERMVSWYAQRMRA